MPADVELIRGRVANRGGNRGPSLGTEAARDRCSLEQGVEEPLVAGEVLATAVQTDRSRHASPRSCSCGCCGRRASVVGRPVPSIAR